MVKQLLSVSLAVAVMSQGIGRADEPARADEVVTVPNHAALLAHIDGLAAGDRIVVATDEGVVGGELVDRDANDLLIDRPLIEGGAERIAIPLKEIQGVRYQSSSPPQTRFTRTGFLITAVVIGTAFLLIRLLGPAGP